MGYGWTIPTVYAKEGGKMKVNSPWIYDSYVEFVSLWILSDFMPTPLDPTPFN